MTADTKPRPAGAARRAGAEERGKQPRTGRIIRTPPLAERLFRAALERGVGGAALDQHGRAVYGHWLFGRLDIVPAEPDALRPVLLLLARRAGLEVPGEETIRRVAAMLVAEALARGRRVPVHTRVGGEVGEGEVYLDLADQKGHAVRITPDGWEVIRNPRIAWTRPPFIRPLPEPQPPRQPLAELLRPLLPPAEDPDEALVLLAGWMLSALHPTGPYPVLVLDGPEGSGKSSLGYLLRSCLDPRSVTDTGAPREERDLDAIADALWLVALDNLSELPQWLSDATCRLATGGGRISRQLYTQSSAHVAHSRRPVVLTGIGLEAQLPPDLRSRAYVVRLAGFAQGGDGRRRSERAVEQAIREAVPEVLGALCDAVSAALRHYDAAAAVLTGNLPRLGEPAIWVHAAEMGGALGWEPGTFIETVHRHQREAARRAVDSHDVASAVVELLERSGGTWTGSASDLHAALAGVARPDVVRSPYWPRTARALGMALATLRATLPAAGVQVERRHAERGTVYSLSLHRQPEEGQDEPAVPLAAAFAVDDFPF